MAKGSDLDRVAGLARENCRGVVLLTGDEDVNLKIAVMTRLLNPAAEVVCRSTSREHEEELVSCPEGTWVLCGYDKLGRWLYRSLTDRAVDTVLIDPNISQAEEVN